MNLNFEINRHSKICISKNDEIFMEFTNLINLEVEQHIEEVRVFADFNNIIKVPTINTLSFDMLANKLDYKEFQFIEYIKYCYNLNLDLEILTDSGNYIKTSILKIDITSNDFIEFGNTILHFEILISSRFDYLYNPKIEVEELLQEEKEILTREEYLICFKNEMIETLKSNNNKIGNFNVSREELLKYLYVEEY